MSAGIQSRRDVARLDIGRALRERDGTIRPVAILAVLLAIHAALLAYSAARHSPVWEEYWHLLAGISHWETGRFDLFRVNPPLVRTVATIPMMFTDYEMDWSDYIAPDGKRPEWWLREDFFRLNGPRIFSLTILARWACIPFSLVGGLVCYLWAAKLWGPGSGLVAAVIWCFCPNILGNGQLIMPDVAAAAMGVAAHYAFWRYLCSPSAGRAIGSGVLLGLTLLTKSTWIVLPPIWVVFWIAWRWKGSGVFFRGTNECCSVKPPPPQKETPDPLRPRWRELLLITLAFWYVLNLGYLFEGTFTPLGEYRFISEALGGDPEEFGLPQHIPRNPYRDTWLAHIPVPLPKNFIAGIDIQRWDFESGRWSYLRGEWRHGGWWYYYLYAMAIKIPLGVWGLGALALGLRISDFRLQIGRRRGATAKLQSEICNLQSEIDRPHWMDEAFLLTPAIAVLTLVSSQTGFNHHMRYVLPAFGFLFIWISQAARDFRFRISDFRLRRGAASTPKSNLKSLHEKICNLKSILVLALLAWFIASSLYRYPHGLSYFNELAGGPASGWRHLTDSNTDGGQDLLYLQQWYESHPQARPVGIAHWTQFVPLTWLGIEASRPPTGLSESADPAVVPPGGYGPLPGWYVLSVNKLAERGDGYKYFRYMTPVERIGYSMNVYHVTLEEANRVRRLLGHREL